MPKFIQSDEIINIKATKEFTDREEPRRVFWEKYNLIKSQMNNQAPIQVLTYYGFGGIGKTSLLHKLLEEVNQKEPESKIEFLDFEKLVEFNNNLLDILKVIRQDLKDKYKFTFPIFDLVVYVYETKMGKTTTKPELSSIFDDNKELGFLKDVISDIPLIGTFAKVIYYADTGKNLIQERLRNHKLRQRLLEIENTSVEDIKEHLAYYFSIDLVENLKNEKRPFVFFIDTYEKLVNELTQIGDPLKNDLWLRSDEGLICRVPNVIWVIAGREKLKWQDLDESWDGTLEQHLLGTLSFQDTSSFLKTAGIEQDELIKQIFNLTHGTPMYLDMCVDTYVKLKEQGKNPTIEDFGGDTTKLVNRFLMYMKDAERDFSTMLAYVPEWTDETIEEISMKMNGTFSYSLYEKVKNFSFVVNENGKYKMHESIKDIIIANTPEILRTKYQKILQENENSKLEKIVEDEERRAEERLKGDKISIEGKSKDKTEGEKNQEGKIGTEGLKDQKGESEGTESIEESIIQKIPNLDRYESKKAYKQLIENLRRKLIDEKDEEQFNVTAKFLLEKLNEYEEKFNETIELKDMYFTKFKENKYFKLLQVYQGDRVSIDYNTDKLIANYKNWVKQYGENDKWALFEIKHLLRWNTYPINSVEKVKPLFELVSSKLGKDNLYYISLCALCLYNNEGKQQEFIERIRAYSYNHEPDRFYMRLILNASNSNNLEGCLMEKYNDWGSTFFTYYEEKYEKEVNKEAIYNFNIAIKTLKDNPNLLDERALELIGDTYESFSRFGENPLINIAFEYIYGVRYIALSTSNQEIIDKFLNIFKAFLGGENNRKESIVQDKNIINKVIDFMKELKEHYIDLYGKDHYNVNEIEDYIDKFEKLTPETFEKRIQSRINRYGINDERTIRTFYTYIKEIQNQAPKRDEHFEAIKIDTGYFDFIFNFTKELLLNCEDTEKMHDLVDEVQKCLNCISSERYYNCILEIDKILLDSYKENSGLGKPWIIFNDAKEILKIKYNEKDRDKKQTEDAIEMVETILTNKYSSSILTGVMYYYIIFNTYYLVENEKSTLHSEKLIAKCDDVEKSIKKISFPSDPVDDFKDLYDDLTGEKEMKKKWDWISLNQYTVVVDKIKYLRNMYKDEFGENNSRTILLTACVGLLETLLYIKDGPRTIEEAFNRTNPKDMALMEKLNKIKEIEERTLAIYRDLKFKNLDLLEVSLSDIYQKAKWGANLPQ